jgi:tetratricopeptide (TPR) repeat protein
LEFWVVHYAKQGDYALIANRHFEELKYHSDAGSEWLRLNLLRLAKQNAAPESNSDHSRLASDDVESTKTVGEADYRQVMEEFVNAFVPDSSSPQFTNAIVELARGLSRSDSTDRLQPMLRFMEARQNDPSLLTGALAVAMIRLSGDPATVAVLAGEIDRRADSSQELSNETLMLAGDAMYVAGDYERAEQYYRRVLDRSPDNVDAMNNLAIVLADAGQTEAVAMELANRVIGIEPENTDRKDTKLVVAILLNDIESANAIAKQLVGESSGQVLLHRSYLALLQDEPGQAGQLFNQARDARVGGTLVAPADKRMYEVLQRQFLQSPPESSQVRVKSTRLRATHRMFVEGWRN